MMRACCAVMLSEAQRAVVCASAMLLCDLFMRDMPPRFICASLIRLMRVALHHAYARARAICGVRECYARVATSLLLPIYVDMFCVYERSFVEKARRVCSAMPGERRGEKSANIIER